MGEKVCTAGEEVVDEKVTDNDNYVAFYVDWGHLDTTCTYTTTVS